MRTSRREFVAAAGLGVTAVALGLPEIALGATPKRPPLPADAKSFMQAHGIQRVRQPNWTTLVKGQRVTTLQSGHKYVNCIHDHSWEFTNLSDVWVKNPVSQSSYYMNLKGNINRCRFEADAAHPLEWGHTLLPTYGGEIPQIKTDPSNNKVPTDLTFIGCGFIHGQRASTTAGLQEHVEGLQVGGAVRIEFNRCRGAENDIFNLFFRSWIGIAGINYAPITDVVVIGGRYDHVTNHSGTGNGSYSIMLDGDNHTSANSLVDRFVCVDSMHGDSIVLSNGIPTAYGARNTDLQGNPISIKRAGSREARADFVRRMTLRHERELARSA